MSGDKKGKKLLHEHEAFLLAFFMLFLLGGFAFWGYGAYAIEYYVGDSLDAYSEPLTYQVTTGNEKVVNVKIKNLEKDPNVDVAVAIMELDPVCTIITGSEEIADSDCENVDIEIEGDTTLYSDETTDVKITFSSDDIIKVKLDLNVVTSEEIDTLSFTFDAVDYDVIDDSEDTSSDTLLEVLLSILGGEEAEEETKEELITYVDKSTNIGFTTIDLDFGSLDISEGEQETKNLGVEYLGQESIKILSISKPRWVIVVPAGEILLESGVRNNFEVTCAPTSAEEVEKDAVIFRTEKGDIVLDVYCRGIIRDQREIDNTAPTIKILQPMTGPVEGVTKIKIEARDDGSISDVATLKVYFGNSLIKRFIEPTIRGTYYYEFSVDSSKYPGIKNIRAIGVDYAGNKGEAETLVWVNKKEAVTNQLQEEKAVASFDESKDYDTGDIKIKVRRHGTKIYSDVATEDTSKGGKADLRIDSKLSGVGNFRLEFIGADLEKTKSVAINEKDIELKDFGNEKEVIDIPDEKLKKMIEVLNAQSVSMPMLKPDDYGSPEDLNLFYYCDDGTPYGIEDGEVLSITEDGDILYIEISKDAIVSYGC